MLSTAVFRHPDGRKVACGRYGAEDGRPVLLCAPLTGGRASGGWFAAAAARLGALLLVPDRPGVGRSDALPQRAAADWVADAALVLDTLGVAELPVAAVSAGCLYAAALQRQLPERVSALALVTPFASLRTPGFPRWWRAGRRLGASAGPAGRLLRWQVRRYFRRPPADRDLVEDADPADEAAAQRTVAFRDNMDACLKSSFAQGWAGWAQELRLCLQTDEDYRGLQPRGPCAVYVGARDALTPPAVGRAVASRIPGARCVELPGATHKALIVPRVGEAVLGFLLGVSAGVDVGGGGVGGVGGVGGHMGGVGAADVDPQLERE